MDKRARFTATWLLPILPVVFGLVLLLGESISVQTLRNHLFDQYQRWQPRTYIAAPVRIIDIDDASLNRLGQWPWPRTRLAELLDRLNAAGVAAIGFDVIFAEPDRTSPQAAATLWGLRGRLRDELAHLPDHDKVFAEHLKTSDAVLGFAVDHTAADESKAAAAIPKRMGRFIFSGEPATNWLHPFSNLLGSLPDLATAAKGNGALTFVPDSDGIVRRVPLALRVGETPVGTLTSEVLRVGQGGGNVVLKSAEHGSGIAEIRIGELTIPTTPHGEIWVHYSAPVAERYIPAWQIYSGEVAPEKLAGHLVLIGSSAQGLMDLRFNPLGRLMPGVEAHAQALEQILNGQYLERPSWARGLEAICLLIGGLSAGLLALRLGALTAALATLGLLTGLVFGSWQSFSAYGLLLDSATPAITILLAFVIGSLVHHWASEREQRWIKQAFARYVSPNRVAHLVDNPEAMELGGRRQQCSFIFTDLAGFTSLMEKIDPAEAVALLNAYLDEMIAIAFRHEGTLDRIVGDAVAIMFSAPLEQADHRQRALRCAIEMERFAERYAEDLQARGIAFGHTRIGVHSGEVIVGNFGGSNMFDYRALGDPVNTAARLESVNKHLGTHLCVSESIAADNPEVEMRPIGRLVLKGKTEALAVFEPSISPAGRCPLADYLTAYAAMAEQSSDALAHFDRLLTDYPDDPLLLLHRRRLAAGEKGDLIVMSEK